MATSFGNEIWQQATTAMAYRKPKARAVVCIVGYMVFFQERGWE